MIKIIILIILGIIIFSGTWYLLYQLYKRIHYGITGPKKCFKVLKKLTKNRVPIIVTNIIRDDNNVLDRYSKAFKKVTGKDTAIFPTLQKEVVKFIWDFMRNLEMIYLKPPYEEFFSIDKKHSGKYVVLYIPTEYVKDYLDYIKGTMENKNAENS